MAAPLFGSSRTAPVLQPLSTAGVREYGMSGIGFNPLMQQIALDRGALDNVMAGVKEGQEFKRNYYDNGLKAQKLFEEKETARERIDADKATNRGTTKTIERRKEGETGTTEAGRRVHDDIATRSNKTLANTIETDIDKSLAESRAARTAAARAEGQALRARELGETETDSAISGKTLELAKTDADLWTGLPEKDAKSRAGKLDLDYYRSQTPMAFKFADYGATPEQGAAYVLGDKWTGSALRPDEGNLQEALQTGAMFGGNSRMTADKDMALSKEEQAMVSIPPDDLAAAAELVDNYKRDPGSLTQWVGKVGDERASRALGALGVPADKLGDKGALGYLTSGDAAPRLMGAADSRVNAAYSARAKSLVSATGANFPSPRLAAMAQTRAGAALKKFSAQPGVSRQDLVTAADLISKVTEGSLSDGNLSGITDPGQYNARVRGELAGIVADPEIQKRLVSPDGKTKTPFAKALFDSLGIQSQ
jgi:hypothetical protein